MKETKLMYKSFLAAFALLILSVNIFAQSGSTLSGTVVSKVNDDVIPGVLVKAVGAEVQLTTETEENGEYALFNLPDGNYTVITHIEGYSDKAQKVTVSGNTTLDFTLSLQSINSEVTVTATGESESVYESFSSVNSVGTTRISEKASISVGEILEHESGVNKRSFGGSGTGRPSIRGFDGDRVLILQDGIRNGSLGAQSGDHGEPIAPFNLERLEIIKGPATLVYGGNAIGGVVNAVTDDENRAHEGFRGYLTGLGGTVNRQAGIAGGLEYGYENNLFNLNLTSAREGDYKTPLGEIPNSASNATSGSGGYGYFLDNAFLRGTASIDRRRYGIPYAPLFESGEVLSFANRGADCNVVDCQFDLNVIQNALSNELPPVPDEQIDIKMRRNNFRFVGGFRDLDTPFMKITEGSITLDYTDYRHRELEIENSVETIATTFDNDVFSYRAILNGRGGFLHANSNRASGQYGIEGYRRTYQTVGAESLIDGRVRQNNFALFTLRNISFNRVALQLGGRIEFNRYNPSNIALDKRNFTGFSGAIGLRFNVWDGGSLVATYSRSYRPPSLEELYNNGPHIGTVTFEIGNQNLTRELANGFEVSFRQNSERVRLNGSFYYNDIDNFIYLSPLDADGNGLIDAEDGLPVGVYVQGDSRFLGADASLEVDVNDNFGVFMIGDIVDAELKNLNTPLNILLGPLANTPLLRPLANTPLLRPLVNAPLPRIAPAKLRIGTNFNYEGLSLRPEAVFAARKGTENISRFETPTAGYSLFNINGSYAFATENTTHIFTFSFHNVGNRKYRNHTNLIKYLTPEAGRGLKASYTVRFF